MAKRPLHVWTGTVWDDVSGPTPTSETIKFDSGTTEGTDLYTFDGTVAKTIDIKAGSNVTLTKAAGSITIASTAAGGGGISLGTATPLVNGIAAVGNSASASHENHVHPTDTSRAPAASPTFSGTITTPLTTAGLVTTTSGGVLGSLATIANSYLTNSSVTFNGTAVALGASGTITANTTNAETIKFDTGTTEGTDLYTFNGSAAKTIDIKAGTNITLTKAAGSITIAAAGGGGGTTTNAEIIKFDTGVTEGTDLYTFNGSAAKTIDIKAGSNITLTKAAGSITIASTGAGGTTVGGNLLNLTNPSALSLPRLNADNTVTAVPIYSMLANLQGLTETATAGGTTTLTVASTPMQQFTGTQAQTIVLPVTSTLTLGQNYWIDNNSTQNLTVNSSGGNLVITVPPLTTAICTCRLTSGTTAASWDGALTEFNTVTGTGGTVVMATSPTFVTSVIGGATMSIFNTTSTTVNAFGAATTATIGGTPTGAITANLFNNVTASGSTKAINIGTSGAAGSTTNITIGSTTGTSTVTIQGKLVTEDYMIVALSDEATALTTGAAVVTMRAPFAMTLTQIPRASLATASSSGNPTVDIKEAGVTILGANKLSIDATEKTSVTAATATTLADTAIADDAELTFDITVAGTGAKGLKVILYYKKA